MNRLLDNVWKNFPTRSALLLAAAFASWNYAVGLPSVLGTIALTIAAYTFRREKNTKLTDVIQFMIPMIISLYAFHFKPLSALATFLAARLSNFSSVNAVVNTARLLATKIPFRVPVTKAFEFATKFLPSATASFIERTVNMTLTFALSNSLVSRLLPIVMPKILYLLEKIGLNMQTIDSSPQLGARPPTSQLNADLRQEVGILPAANASTSSAAASSILSPKASSTVEEIDRIVCEAPAPAEAAKNN